MGNSIQGGRAHLTDFSRQTTQTAIILHSRLTLVSFSLKSGEAVHAC